MANNQTQNVKKEVKFLLGNLFTDAKIKVEPEEESKVLVAGLKEAHPKKNYSDGFFGKAFSVVKGEFQTLIKASIFFLIFTVPFIVMLAWFAGYYENLILANTYNFMGDIGVGFPGTGDSIAHSVSQLYWDVKEPVACVVAAAIIFGSIGLSGQFYCAKRSYYQDFYKKTVKTYWMGFAKYWWKYILVSIFAVLIGLAMATSLLNLLSKQAIDAATAGDYCGVVFSFIIGCPLLLIPFVMLGLMVSYELTFTQALKNSLVIIANSPLFVIISAILCVAPALICLGGMLLSIVVYVVMAIVGFNLEALLCIAVADKGMKICSAKKAATTKKAQVIYAKTQKVEKKVNNQKKKQQPTPYVNPKKKKKK